MSVSRAEILKRAFATMWGIRHVRAMAFCYACNRHYDMTQSIGFIGGWTDAEIRHWEAIKRGNA